MPLPAEVVAGLYLNGLSKARDGLPATKNHSEITGVNVTRDEQFYNLAYDPGPGARRPGYQVTDSNPRNCLFVNNIPNGVAISVLPRTATDTYVFSDNYAGCEFHVITRADHSAAAFLHVYRTGGIAHPYVLGGNWVLKGTVQSVGLAGVNASVVSYAYVPAATWIAECCMLVLNNQGMVTAVHRAVSIAL